MKNLRRLALYIEKLDSRTRLWEGISHGDGSCVLLDLWFAKQWIERGDGGWAWGCAQNARSLARKLGIMRVARA